MRHALKWIGITLGSLLGLLVIAVGTAFLLFDWNWFREAIVTRASEATGRKVSIEGDINGDLSLIPRIRMSGIRVANADWAADRAANMISVERLDLRIELLELLRGRLVLPEIAVAGARVSLAKRRDGTPNWKFGPSVAGAATEAAVPEDRTEFPVIGKLTIDDSEMGYSDPAQDLDITVRVSRADAEGGEERGVRFVGNGRYRGEKVNLALTAGRLLDLREEGKPYPVDLALSVGKTTFEGRGTALEPLNFDGLELDLELAGPNLADLFPVIGIPLPPTAGYRLSGHLSRKGDVWSFRQLDGRVGRSDLAGDLMLDSGPKVPFMKAALTSNRLDFDDLGGFIGAPPNQKVPTRGSNRVLPDMKIELSRLRAMNMRVDFNGTKIVTPNLPIDKLQTALVLQDGKLILDPFTFGVARGTISGPLVLDGRDATPVVRMNLTLRGMQLQPFLTKVEMGEMTTGTLGGKLKLAGRGNSLAEVLGSADGRVTMAMVGGTINPLLVELIGLDIAESLAIVLTENQPMRIRCVLGDLTANDGTLQINGFVIDTPDSNVWVGGNVDLRHERLSLRVRADPKDASLLSANAPVAISGPLKSPDVAIDTLGTEDKGGIGEAIGKVANPILALLPFVDLGLAEDTDCRHLASDGKEGQPAEPPPKGADRPGAR